MTDGTSNYLSGLIILILGACLGFGAAFYLIVASGGKPRHVFEAEAVKAGAAEYYLDHENNRQFRWKDRP